MENQKEAPRAAREVAAVFGALIPAAVWAVLVYSYEAPLWGVVATGGIIFNVVFQGLLARK